MSMSRLSMVVGAIVVAGTLSCQGSGTTGPGPRGPDTVGDTVAPPAEALVVQAEVTSEAPPPVSADGDGLRGAVSTPPLPGEGPTGAPPSYGATPTYPTPTPGSVYDSRVVTATPGGPPPSMAPPSSPGVELEAAPRPTSPSRISPSPVADSAAASPTRAGGRVDRAEAPPARAAGERAAPREPRGRRPRDRSGPPSAPVASEASDAPASGASMDDSGGYYGGSGGLTLGAPEAAPYPAPYQQVQVLRVLTAATVADVDRRSDYLAYLTRHPGPRAQLGLDMSRRVRFRIVDGGNRPVHDASLTLVGQGFHVSGRTHADGFWDFFPSFSAPQAGGPTTVYIQAGGQTSQAVVEIPYQGDGRDIFIRLPQTTARPAPVLDLGFLIDVTGSMGDELRYVNEEVLGIVERVRAAVPSVVVRVGATFYRDRGDMIPIEQIPFSTDTSQFVARMRYVQATGGGDYPEDLNLGLAAALTTQQWSTTPAVRVLVLIADAPPQMYHDFPYTYRDAMADASRRGIRILPVAASGADRVVEFLFRAMGAFTSTPYVYLTDDSGIGGRHMEADTEQVTVEMFSDSLTRLLVSDLQGFGMHEPGMPQLGIGAPLQ